MASNKKRKSNKNNNKTYKCKKCDQEFPTVPELGAHCKHHHPKAKPAPNNTNINVNSNNNYGVLPTLPTQFNQYYQLQSLFNLMNFTSQQHGFQAFRDGMNPVNPVNIQHGYINPNQQQLQYGNINNNNHNQRSQHQYTPPIATPIATPIYLEITQKNKPPQKAGKSNENDNNTNDDANNYGELLPINEVDYLCHGFIRRKGIEYQLNIPVDIVTTLTPFVMIESIASNPNNYVHDDDIQVMNGDLPPLYAEAIAADQVYQIVVSDN